MYVSTISLFATIVFGFSAFDIGIFLMVSGIFRVIIRFTIFIPILKKLGEVNTLKVGLVTFVIVFFLWGFCRDIYSFMVLLIIISFAASMTRGPLNSLISQSVKPKHQGAVNGNASSLDSFGQIVGPLVGTFILSLLHPGFLGFITACVAAGAFIMIFNVRIYRTVIESREKRMKSKKIDSK